MEATSECTRYISIDFTVPPDEVVTGSSEGRVLVPLGLIRKGPLAAFSISGPSGRAAPTLETAANGETSVQLLSAVAENVTSGGSESDTATLLELCRAVVFHGGPPDENLTDRIADVLSPFDLESDARQGFTRLIEQFENNFLLIVELDAEVIGQRSVVKFNYREPMPHDDLRPSRPRLTWEVPEFGSAGSVHVEFCPPPLLLVDKATLTEINNGSRQDVVVSTSVLSTAHLVGRPRHRFVTGELTVELVPRPYGAITAMRVGALVIAAVYLFGVALRWLRMHDFLPIGPIGTGPPAALLAAGGLLLTWVARTPEDWTTSQILFNARRSLLISAALAVAAAGYLSVPIGHEDWRTAGWVILWLGTMANAVVAERLWRDCRLPVVASTPPTEGTNDGEQGADV